MSSALQDAWASLMAKPGPLRVGLLNTGELVLVADSGHAQVLSPLTTDTIRDVLDAAQCTTPHVLGPAPAPDSVWAPDPVHQIIKEACR